MVALNKHKSTEKKVHLFKFLKLFFYFFIFVSPATLFLLSRQLEISPEMFGVRAVREDA